MPKTSQPSGAGLAPTTATYDLTQGQTTHTLIATAAPRAAAWFQGRR